MEFSQNYGYNITCGVRRAYLQHHVCFGTGQEESDVKDSGFL